MKKQLIGYTAKANNKTTCFIYANFSLILNCIVTENASQYACNSTLPFVDLGTSLEPKDSIKTKSSAPLDFLLEFDLFFAISQTSKKEIRAL